MPVVAGAGEPLRGDRAQLGAGAGLQRVEQPEADRLLQLGIALELDVGAVPERIEVRALRVDEAVPAGMARLRQRRDHLVADRRERAPARPAVREELDDAQARSLLEIGRDGDAADVRAGLGGDVRAIRTVHDVIDGRPHPELTPLRRVQQNGAGAAVEGPLGLERRLEDGRRARVGRGHRGARRVREQLGLHDHPERSVDRLDLVEDRSDRALGERHEARGADAYAIARRRRPFRPPREGSRAQVEHALVREQLPVADVERLVVDEQADDLRVRDVDDRLARLRIAVARLGDRQRSKLVERVQVRAGQAVRLALVEVAAQPDVPVREREDRLRLREDAEIELGLPQRPRLDRERRVRDHRRSSSARSSTTTSAPCSSSASRWPTRSTPTTKPKLPARPAPTPASASSKTAACAGSRPKARAA